MKGRLAAFIAAIVFLATSVSAQTLQNTTLTADLDATSGTLLVTSSTGMQPGFWLMVDRETTIVLTVNGTTVTVRRDYAGVSSIHNNGAVIFYGPAFYFNTSNPPSEACLVGFTPIPFVNAYTGHAWICRHNMWLDLTLPGVTLNTALMGTGPAGPLVSTALSQSNSLPVGVATGSVLASNGVGVSGVWSASPTLTNLTLTGTLTLPSGMTVVNGGTGITSYLAGDLVTASAPTTLSRLADVAIGQVLTSGGVGVAPVWSGAPTLSTALKVGTTPALTGEIRLPNASSIYGRNAANDNNVLMLQLWSDDQIYMGKTGTAILPANTNAQDVGSATFKWGSGYFGTALIVGTNPATVGSVRLPNSGAGAGVGTITARNNANTLDISLIQLFSDDQIYLGTGTGQNVVPNSTNVQDLGGTAAKWRTGYFGTAVSVGTTPAATGTVRLPTLGTITARNAANSADITMLQMASSDRIFLGGGGNIQINIDPGTADVVWAKPLVALGLGATPTFGTIGGTGPTVAGQNAWMRIFDSTGAPMWIPVWK